MNCPRCGASGFTGVCDECGFPVTRLKRVLYKVYNVKRIIYIKQSYY